MSRAARAQLAAELAAELAPRGEVNIYAGSDYDEELHAKIIEILSYEGRRLSVIAGRRFGKSYNVSLLALSRFLDLMQQWDDEVKRGEREPWSGLTQTKAQDVRQWKLDAVRFNIVTYSVEQYEVIRTYIRWHLRQTGAECYLHPNPDLHRTDRGREMWFQLGEAAGCIQFRCASQDAQLVGDKCHILWIDECGLVENSSFHSLQPLLWEFEGYLFLSGTPRLGEDHWFTRECMKGLPDDHPMANQQVVERDPTCHTVHATALDAYSERTREQAARELEDYGPESLYAKLMILADWRLPSLFIYDNWKTDIHVRTFTVSQRGVATLQRKGRDPVELPRWDAVYGAIDWFEGYHPGGGVCIYYWAKNPLNEDDSRPLLAVAAECHGKYAYTTEPGGWWAHFRGMDDAHRPFKWFADPHNPRLILEAQKLGLFCYGADAADKLGRIGLIHGLLHWTETLEPALVVSAACPVAARQFGGYQRQIARYTGEVKEEPKQYDDALLDALAFVVGEIVAPLAIGGGAA